MRARRVGVQLLAMLVAGITYGDTFRGVVSPVRYGNICEQGRHDLISSCGGPGIRIASSVYDLGPHACREVIATGTIVGAECDVLDIYSMTPTDLSCPLLVRDLTFQGPHSLQWDPFPCFALVRGYAPGIGNTAYGFSSSGLEETPPSGACP